MKTIEKYSIGAGDRFGRQGCRADQRFQKGARVSTG
jgi:hypothetical protein